jgi:hypothetical protein
MIVAARDEAYAPSARPSQPQRPPTRPLKNDDECTTRSTIAFYVRPFPSLALASAPASCVRRQVMVRRPGPSRTPPAAGRVRDPGHQASVTAG